jgi:hypothetical protein
VRDAGETDERSAGGIKRTYASLLSLSLWNGGRQTHRDVGAANHPPVWLATTRSLAHRYTLVTILVATVWSASVATVWSASKDPPSRAPIGRDEARGA